MEFYFQKVVGERQVIVEPYLVLFQMIVARTAQLPHSWSCFIVKSLPYQEGGCPVM